VVEIATFLIFWLAGCKDEWIGDGNCDDENNNAKCKFDGGDCCGSNVNKQFCSDCTCKGRYFRFTLLIHKTKDVLQLIFDIEIQPFFYEYENPYRYFRSLNIKKITSIPILLPSLPKLSLLPETMRTFEILWGKFVMIQFYSLDKDMDGPWQGLGPFWAKVYKRSFVILNQKAFGQKIFWNRCTETKCLISYLICQIAIWHFCPSASISKLFWPNEFWLGNMQELLNSFA